MTVGFTNEPIGICPTRRKFLGAGGGGLGVLALSGLWPNAQLPPAAAEENSHQQLLAPIRTSQLAAPPKRCIYIYLEGGPSQMDLFDPKPRLNQMHGQALPSSMLENMQFAFIQKEGARVSWDHLGPFDDMVRAVWSFPTSCLTWPAVPTTSP